jgi:death-on-curing protein
VKKWRWVSAQLAYALHDRQIAEHGGLDGVRDVGAIESALARPRNIAAYDKPDAAWLAAAYCFGMVKDHGFADGNKRVGWLLARVFLADNGFTVAFDKLDAIQLVEGVAAGSVDEVVLAAWFRAHMRKQ